MNSEEALNEVSNAAKLEDSDALHEALERLDVISMSEYIMGLNASVGPDNYYNLRSKKACDFIAAMIVRRFIKPRVNAVIELIKDDALVESK